MNVCIVSQQLYFCTYFSIYYGTNGSVVDKIREQITKFTVHFRIFIMQFPSTQQWKNNLRSAWVIFIFS
jgi:hypothetical protein